ncbi:MAG: hypothetical protein IJD92_01425 [Bacilli bacterium]|nr:hypothetical protein [Bacilli bacterium]
MKKTKTIVITMTILTLITITLGSIYIYKIMNIEKDPRELLYLEAKSLFKESEINYNFYSEEVIKAINILNDIKGYKDSTNILNEKYNFYKKEIELQKNNKSINKEYDIKYLIEFIEKINIDKINNEKKEYICNFAIEAYNEGFVSNYYINLLNSNCKNASYIDEKYNNLNILINNNWSLDIQQDKDTLMSYFIEFKDEEISIKEEIISSNSVPANITTGKYKILDNIIYIKEREEYKKLYTIEEITSESLKLSEFNFNFDKM